MTVYDISILWGGHDVKPMGDILLQFIASFFIGEMINKYIQM